MRGQWISLITGLLAGLEPRPEGQPTQKANDCLLLRFGCGGVCCACLHVAIGYAPIWEEGTKRAKRQRDWVGERCVNGIRVMIVSRNVRQDRRVRLMVPSGRKNTRDDALVLQND